MKIFEAILKFLIVLGFIIGTILWYFILPGTDKGVDNFLKSIPSEEKMERVCKIEGKKVQQNNERLPPSMLNRYFNGGHCFYIESSFYYTDTTKSNEFGEILNFRSPLICNGLGGLSKIAIEEYPDKFIFYYTKESQDGFSVIHNPFSKEIVFEQVSDSELNKIENKLCEFGI
ncbi:MAG: hypothetical protein IK012_12985 [Fibrobacter sp.]|uniref:hypothetical protein n=1 Tax=Fibrobacter sp. TaxID=35828 RepID=UPI0025C6A3D6|nr:hypothetical protein [Fibrobacter sp.]MBR4786146.1 hypothetical protein [Fibrobacter sp.]